MDDESLKVLQLVSNGAITAEEGLSLFNSLEIAGDSATSGITPVDTVRRPMPVGQPSWAEYWPYPLSIGAFSAALGLAYTLMIIVGQIHWAWIFLTLPALTLGGLLGLFGWLMRSSPWLRVSIQDNNLNLNFSLPLPLHWLAKLFPLARPFVPQLRDRVTDDILETLASSMTTLSFNVEVQEASGEHVFVTYG